MASNFNISIGYESLLKEMYDLLYRLKIAVTGEQWEKVLSDAIDPVTRAYKGKAQQHKDTGNLARAVSKKYVDYSDQVHVIVGGPKYRASANHAWLVEYGTRGPRRPGSNKKNIAPSLVIRDAVNNKTLMNSRDFEKAQMGDARFFMGNKRRGFFMALGPGQTYGAMPAGRWMANAYQANDSQVKRLLHIGIQRMIQSRRKS